MRDLARLRFTEWADSVPPYDVLDRKHFGKYSRNYLDPGTEDYSRFRDGAHIHLISLRPGRIPILTGLGLSDCKGTRQQLDQASRALLAPPIAYARTRVGMYLKQPITLVSVNC